MRCCPPRSALRLVCCDRQFGRSGRGFSLIELVVVLVILAVVLGVAAPRLATISGGKTRAAAQQTAVLLSAVARREQLSSQPIAIDFDGVTGRLAAHSKRSTAAGSMSDWAPDPLIAPVDLSECPPTAVNIGDDAVDPSRFRIDLRLNFPRPTIRIAVQGSDAASPLTVVLPAGRLTAGVAGPNDDLNAHTDVAIDLDAAGKGDDAW